MNDVSDQSYYEIALTNRQVVVFFVALMVFLLVVFLCGVWVGQNGQQRLVQTIDNPDPVAAPAGEELANMEEFNFFAGEQDRPDSPTGTTPPDPPRGLREVVREPAAETTLAQDIGSQAPPTRTGTETASKPRTPPAAPPVSPPPREAPSASPPPPRPAPAKATPPPAEVTPAAAAAAQGGFVIQVFSSRDEAQARKVRKQLSGAGHKAFMSPVKVGNQTMYRVRIGPFAQRSQAESSAVGIKKQFRLETWITAAEG